MSEVFITQTKGEGNPTPTNYVEELVKARGDQWNDPQVIAKGKLEADQMIEKLINEKRELEEKVWKQDYQEQLLAELKNQGTPASVSSSEPKEGGNVSDNVTALTPDAIETLVEKTLSQREVENTRNRNLQTVNASLTEAYGTEAEAKVAERAAALGMSKDKLAELAGESPSAFMSLMGQPAPKLSGVTTSTRNTAAMEQPSGVGWSYYQKMRQENPKLYNSAKVQSQMLEHRKSDPDFFNK